MADIAPIVIGVFITILGFLNMKGDVRSVHWYHRKRISAENIRPFGHLIGLGTVICGASIICFGTLSLIAEKAEADFLLIPASILVVIGLAVGLIISLRAILKYNGSLF